MSYVYWVHDDTCNSAVNSGYVGVSEDPASRLHALRIAGTVPRGSQQAILFEGTRKECLVRERQLRPRCNIGWNKARGGVAPDPLKHGPRIINGVFPKDLFTAADPLQPLIDDLLDQVRRGAAWRKVRSMILGEAAHV
jgi:hypothetical protein